MKDKLIAALGLEWNLTAEEIADIFWLTLIRQQVGEGSAAQTWKSSKDIPKVSQATSSDALSQEDSGNSTTKSEVSKSSQRAQIVARTKSNFQLPPGVRIPFKVPNAPSLREPLALGRALRPLIHRVPSGVDVTLDEPATAQKSAEARIWILVTQPALEPWLELALVVDEGASMLIWRQTVLELQRLLQQYGAFRDLRMWGLVTHNQKVKIRAGIGTTVKNQDERNPEELIDPSGRRLILIVSDCVSPIWHTGEVLSALKIWAEKGPMAILQMLPEWLWGRTGLRHTSAVHLCGLAPGVANQKLCVIRRSLWDESEARTKNTEIKVPILTLEPKMASVWSQMVAGRGKVWCPGFIFQSDFKLQDENVKQSSRSVALEPEQQIHRFWITASAMAWRLAGLLAASPIITLPIVRLIQETMLPKSRQMHVAEVFLGGLLEPTTTIETDTKPDEIEFHFVDEQLRTILLDSTPVTDMMRVLSKFVEKGRSLDDFVADLIVWSQSEDKEKAEGVRPFAEVTAELLRRKGGRFTRLAQQLEQQTKPDLVQTSSSFRPVSVEDTSLLAKIIARIEVLISKNADSSETSENSELVQALVTLLDELQPGLLVEPRDTTIATEDDKYRANAHSYGFFKEIVKQHLVNRQWREVFLIIAGRLANADDFLKILFIQINNLVSSKRLQDMLAWLDDVTNYHGVKSSSWRAFYLFVDQEFELYTNQLSNVDSALAQKLAILLKEFNRKRKKIIDRSPLSDFSLYLVDVCTKVSARVDNKQFQPHRVSPLLRKELPVSDDIATVPQLGGEDVTIDKNRGMITLSKQQRQITLDKDNFPEQIISSITYESLADELMFLQESFPDDNAPQSDWQDWIKHLRGVMRLYLNIGYDDVKFSPEQIKTLKDYLYANILLLECIKGSSYSSQVLCNQIVDYLLLPSKRIPETLSR